MVKIGNFETANNVLAAPMAGVTDRAFREILASFGVGLVCTEMVSDKAICYHNVNTLKLLDIRGELAPVAVQLHGSDPAAMTDAAKYLRANFPFAVLDINMGCPMPKIVKNGAGSALMQDEDLACAIARGVVQAVDLPVTVKMRLGWDENSRTAVQLAQRLEQCGIAAITVHGRTRSQYYTGEADWQAIGEVARAVRIPVIGNGDIFSGEQAKLRLEQSGVAAVMLGRGLLGNPWLVADALAALADRPITGKPQPAQIIELAITHLRREVELCGEYIGVRQMRTHLAWYLKGLHGAAPMREKINHLTDCEQVVTALREFAQHLK